jgi:hypothetical protein
MCAAATTVGRLLVGLSLCVQLGACGHSGRQAARVLPADSVYVSVAFRGWGTAEGTQTPDDWGWDSLVVCVAKGDTIGRLNRGSGGRSLLGRVARPIIVLSIMGPESLEVSSGGLMRIQGEPVAISTTRGTAESLVITRRAIRLATPTVDGGYYLVLRTLPPDWVPSPSPKTSVRIAGRVVGIPGEAPIRGARVLVLGTRCIAFTDSTGRFTVADVPGGTIRMFVDGGSGRVAWESTFVRESNQGDSLRVGLRPRVDARGR